MSFRFLHAADLHLDTPFTGLGQTDEALAAQLRDASLAAWDALVDTAIAEEVDFVVLAGDIYDGPERGVRAQLRFVRGLKRLSEAAIRTFVVHGNHDPIAEGWSAIDRWPDRVTVFGSDGVGEVRFAASDGTPVVVHGISYATRAEKDNLATRFPPAPAGTFGVAILHANVDGDRNHDPYSPCTLDDLRATGHAYWALGHVHTRRILDTRPHVVYPGNLQGRSFAPGERGEKGAVVVTVDGGAVDVRFVALDRVRFAEISLDVTSLVDLEDVQAALLHAAKEATANGRRIVVRGVLTGEASFADALRSPGFLQALRDASPRVWWAALDLRVRPPLDLDAIRRGDDLRAAVLDERDRIADEGVRRIVKEILPAARLALRVDDLDDADLVRILDDAALDALHRLTP